MGAAAAVAGQNLGARQSERAEKAVDIAGRFGLAGATVAGLFFMFFPRQLLNVFGMDEPAVVEIGIQLLRVLSLSGFFVAVALTYTGIQGTGDTKGPLYISIISQIVVPIWNLWRDYFGRHVGSDRCWIAILVGHVTRCALSVLRFKQENGAASPLISNHSVRLKRNKHSALRSSVKAMHRIRRTWRRSRLCSGVAGRRFAMCSLERLLRRNVVAMK